MKRMIAGARRMKEDRILAELEAEVEAAAGGVKKRQGRIDRYLKGTAITLAAGCAMLPFVAYLQRVDMGASAKDDSRITDPLDRSQQKTARRFPPFQPSDRVAFESSIDRTNTGAVMSNGKGLPEADGGKEQEEASGEQPFPKPVFALRDVVGGMAMIEDVSGYWLVEKGSLLPDGSHLVSIGRSSNAGTWRLTTSTGGVIEMKK